jgi:hypothetical protein
MEECDISLLENMPTLLEKLKIPQMFEKFPVLTESMKANYHAHKNPIRGPILSQYMLIL